jgi:hypothetical protein
MEDISGHRTIKNNEIIYNNNLFDYEVNEIGATFRIDRKPS